MTDSPLFVAFLLGVNVGKRRMKMDELTAAMEDLECTSVKTIQAAGTIIFSAESSNIPRLEQELSSGLTEHFGFSIVAIVRTAGAIEEMVARAPFSGTSVDENTRLYVTLTNKPIPETFFLDASELPGFKVLEMTISEIFTRLQLSEELGSTDHLSQLQKSLGASTCTTRNWNSITKVAEVLALQAQSS